MRMGAFPEHQALRRRAHRWAAVGHHREVWPGLAAGAGVALRALHHQMERTGTTTQQDSADTLAPLLDWLLADNNPASLKTHQQM